MGAILETRGLSVEYAGGVRALDDVSLGFGSGELVAVIGPSGAGKSTLLRSLNRLIVPNSGDVYLDGARVTGVSGRALRGVRQRIGMIFQQFNLVPRLTVLENVLVGWIGRAGRFERVPALWRSFPRSVREEAERCLAQVGIADRVGSRADMLSGGQQQRVAIARVLMQHPSAVLADEPIASLDPVSAEAVMLTLRRVCEERGVPVVVNLHQVDMAIRHATRVVGLRRGRVIFDSPSGVIERSEIDRLYLPAASSGHATDGTDVPEFIEPVLAGGGV
jgi:phosphonate transport system ATP-binding protein